MGTALDHLLDIDAQLLAYASDTAFVDNMYRPCRRRVSPGVMPASLDPERSATG